MVQQGSELWYLFFPIVVIFISLSGYKRKNTGKLLLFVLLFFSMFRGDNVGHDTKNYLKRVEYKYDAFDDATDLGVLTSGIGTNLEVVDNSFYYFIHKLDLPSRTILYIYSIITIFFYYFALRRLRVNPSLGLMFYVLLYLYYFSFSNARQMASASVFLYAISFLLYNKRKKFFFLFFILSSAIHFSAFFFIWIYFFQFVKINRTILFYIMVATLFIMTFTDIRLMNLVYNLVNIDIIQGYKGEFEYGTRTIYGRIVDVFIYGFYLFVFKMRNVFKTTDLMDVFFTLGFVISILLAHESLLISRIAFYLSPLMCAYLAMVLYERKLFYGRFQGIFIAYLILVLYTLSGWYISLESGYYLSFF